MDSSFWEDPANNDVEQIKRIIFSQRIKPDKITLFAERNSAQIVGTDGIYDVTPESCTCFDFQSRQLPCKHMYRLLYELTKFEFPKANRKAAKEFKDSLGGQIDLYKKWFLAGAISGEKFVKIMNALLSK